MDGDWVTIIHPEAGEALVHRDSLTHHYRTGWRLLTEDEQAERDAAGPEPDPEPVTRAQAEKAAKTAAKEK